MKTSFVIIAVFMSVLTLPSSLGVTSATYCNPQSIEILTLVAGAEARGANEGPEYVMHVILNRVENRRWPDTIEGVVKQSRQFATVFLSTKLDKLLNHPNPIERAAWRRVHSIAADLACGGREENPFPDVFHFLAPQRLRMKMDPITRQVIDVGRGPSWALGMYVHPVSDGLRHWFLQ